MKNILGGVGDLYGFLDNVTFTGDADGVFQINCEMIFSISATMGCMGVGCIIKIIIINLYFR